MQIKTGQLFLLAFFFLVACKPNSLNEKDENIFQPPNIVIILTDDQGWGDVGFNGNPNLKTPNLDKMASEGVVFDRFYVQPVCSPTRAEMLTGRYALRSGVFGTSEGEERLNLDEKTLASYFKEAGYKTGAFGKWHNGMQHPYHPNSRGFDEFYGFCSGHWGNYIDAKMDHNGKLVQGSGFMPDDLTDHAIEFIEENQNQPFLVYLPFNTPHTPMQMPDEWWDRVKDRELTAFNQNTEAENIAFTKASLAFCENIDWNVGRLMDKLAAMNLEENTIVVFFSDNGPNSWRWNGGMKGRKAHTDEGGVRTPFVMQWKGRLDAGRVVPQVAHIVDLLPTLLDLADIRTEYPKPIDGKSLAPLLRQPDAVWPDRMLVNHWANKTSIRNQKFRLDHQGNLFDMEVDPGQSTAITDRFEAEKRAMQAFKEKFEQEVVATHPETDDRPIPVGHQDARYTWLPARDGKPIGGVERSNRWPNDSYFTNWSSTEDQVVWEVTVEEAAKYKATIYYTCPEAYKGVKLSLEADGVTLPFAITEGYDPPVFGKEYDRIERDISYYKEFKPLEVGSLNLSEGQQTISLKPDSMPGGGAIDFWLLMLEKEL